MISTMASYSHKCKYLGDIKVRNFLTNIDNIGNKSAIVAFINVE